MSPPFSLPLRETSGPGEPCAVLAVMAIGALECRSTDPVAAVLLALRSPAHTAKKLLRVVVSYFMTTIPLSGGIAATARRNRALLIDISRVPRLKRSG